MNPRYSPVNWLIVDWSANGVAFPDCALPQPVCKAPRNTECAPAVCLPIPIREAIDTYDWERWLPEVIVGIEDPNEEIAANYVREAAIEFCRAAQVLQREVYVELQPGVYTYPIYPYEDEQIIGVLKYRFDDDCAQTCGSRLAWRLDVARNQIEFDKSIPCRARTLRMLVWAAPTEGACTQDRFLYDHYRAKIARGARTMYANAVHFRDRALMASLATMDSFTRAALQAKVEAAGLPTMSKGHQGSSLFGRRAR
jgi:hypothetical protein